MVVVQGMGKAPGYSTRTKLYPEVHKREGDQRANRYRQSDDRKLLSHNIDFLLQHFEGR